ncbi:MAG: hypothetical protein JW904_10665 [Spirochaetales bacterium]|nr:hypothetical protein [Spirochaetales bacterium]
MFVKRGLLVLLPVLFVLFVSCGGYNLNFPPPAQDAQPQDIFPAEIDGLKYQLQKAGDIGGLIAVYGKGEITIRASRLKTKDEADIGFKNAILPLFNDFPTRASGKINGIYKASGTDGNGRNYFAWVNNNYIFLIAGHDKSFLEKGIDAFPYIALE